MAVPPASVAPLTRRYQAALGSIAARSVPLLEHVWDELEDYDEEAIDTFAAAIAPYMAAVKRGAVAQSAGYFNSIFGTIVGVDPERVSSKFDPRDPFVMVWRGLQSGARWEDAVAAGRRQLAATVHHYTLSSARRAGDEFVRKTGRAAGGWRRVPNRGACEWCQQAAADIYRRAESADFGHLRCGCTAVPILDGYDPGEAIG